MRLEQLSLLNFKNLRQVDLTFSSKINCLLGLNGMGKTNLLDAIYYLSFCKSHTHALDPSIICHKEDFFLLQGTYVTDQNESELISCGYKRGKKKKFKRNAKEYAKLSEHIGRIPLIMISPADNILISGGSDERRRFMDMVISQYNIDYLNALLRYNKALSQRNALLKQGATDETLFLVWEEMMASEGQFIYQERISFLASFIPLFQRYYSYLSAENESVQLSYKSDVAMEPLIDLLRKSRTKDMVMGYSLKGIHKDDLIMSLGESLIKREGSQGQNKTFLIALKLAQFDFLKNAGRAVTPILLFDDIFDKLDGSRVKKIVQLVAEDNFGQIFMTDTDYKHLERILSDGHLTYKLFQVEQGEITEKVIV
ncbi:MAG: DNA replication and repair protein RecF [Bacteroidaceae bacterium]|nr:DNA replication and repair protein RecF [Bacteroidaceae bacterium]